MLSGTCRVTYPRRRTAGISLVEVLISLVVLSVGLLGTASLQALAKRANFDALQRTVASQLAFELLERMRTNPAALDAYIAQVGGASLAVPVDDCGVGVCTPVQLAAYDLWLWERSLDGSSERNAQGDTGGLSAPNACITGPAAGISGVYNVTVAWRGMTAYTNELADGCGTGLYGDDEDYRRIMTLSTFIAAN